MASTSRSRPTTGRTSLLLLALAATMVSGQTMVSVGCYSSVKPLKNLGSATYQSSGYCQKECLKSNSAVFALSQGNLCYCGNELPASSTETSTSACSIPCQGYPQEMCGGNNAYTVWLTGTDTSPPVYGSSGGGSGASSSASPSTTSILNPVNARPTEVTSIVRGGTTVVVTHNVPAPSSTTNSNSSNSGGSGTSVGAIAGGVVVGVLAVIGIAAAVYFLLKRKKQKEADEESKRTQVSDFIRGGERKAPGSAYSQMSDSRLDPTAGARRNSHGSIADNQDYSRRILRVANPDNS